ncbi:MAG: DUF1127 domain-containing protein [Paracoccaceae bacterium]|nr:DUF1127 domain-containing protein [Paracoccaceae bacterium]
MAYVQSQIKTKDSLVQKLENAVRVVLVKYKKYRLYLTTISELSALTNRELSDLGLSRSMIKSVSFSAVYERCDPRKYLV